MKYFAEAFTKDGRMYEWGFFSKLFEIRVWANKIHANIVNVYLNNADGTVTRYEVWKYDC